MIFRDEILALESKSWPFLEARRILERIQNRTPEKGYVLLETGYGPSGLPHIGTFGEVARTTMVRHAFSAISDIPTRLFAFSDDMDGLRKVPDNVPNQDMLKQHLGKPLTAIPDPFEKYESFGHHNNAMLCKFLDHFGFSYEFQSSTQYYKSGMFDKTLRLILEFYDEIMGVMLPSLREERQATYSPFLPICPRTGQVLQVPIVQKDITSGLITYRDPQTNKLQEVPITGGHCKLQWKVDWAMRWRAFEVDYEMSGKDLIDSVKLSSQICKILQGNPPENLTYELFLDEEGQKISKSKGNGLTIEEWLTYGPTESLSYYMYQSPKKAKRLYFDVIPRHVDEYLNHLESYHTQTNAQKLDNPLWHIHKGQPPKPESSLTFTLLLNVASVCNAESEEILWGFVTRYDKNANPKNMPFFNKLIKGALNYYKDFVKPAKHYRAATPMERDALIDLDQSLEALKISGETIDSTTLQTVVFEVGKRHPFENLRLWFGTLYEVLLGQTEGPRMGSFIELYGLEETQALIRANLKRQD